MVFVEKETAFFWYGNQVATETCRFGSLALTEPILQQMKVAEIINQHLPTDPQAEYDYGSVLSLLVAARLADPVALVNVADWAAQSGAEFLWNIPAAKLNDDRLGRALDALFTQRHSILASISLQVAEAFHLPLEEVHFDPTAILFYGAYADSEPRESLLDATPPPSDADLPPAHITKGWSSPDAPDDVQLLHAGLCHHVDEFGPLPLFGHAIDGNQNSHTAVAEQYALLCRHLRPPQLTMISDRGTCSVGHLARLYRAGHHALCAAPWKEYRHLFAQHRDQLTWKRASYLSREQQRRRREGSLSQEHYELAVLQHEWIDPETGGAIPGRLIFVFSTTDQKVCHQQREKQIERIRGGLEALARSVAEGRRNTDSIWVPRRVQKLLGKSAGARYFRWELVPLSAEEQNRWTPPARGCTRPTHRFVWTLDQAAVDHDAQDDGYSVLVTTVPPQQANADELFTTYKRQIYCEHAHHIFKGPLAVHPVFLKKPERVEALLFLMMIALQAYFVLQRRYRTNASAEEGENEPIQKKRRKPKERHVTARTLLNTFTNYTVLVEENGLGRFIQPTRLSERQREILQRLRLPSPAQSLSQRLTRGP